MPHLTWMLQLYLLDYEITDGSINEFSDLGRQKMMIMKSTKVQTLGTLDVRRYCVSLGYI